MTTEERRTFQPYDEEMQYRLLQWETARLRVKIDRMDGVETPEWIRDLAEHEPRRRPV